MVYSDLQGQLPLKPKHQGNLSKRGLSPEEIHALGYVSLPEFSDRVSVVRNLVERYDVKLLSVPGFYLTDNGHIWLSGNPGLLIPCRDVQGRIVGFQVRADDARGQGASTLSNSAKYRWLSASESKRQHGGVSSGTPIHVSKPRMFSPRQEDSS